MSKHNNHNHNPSERPTLAEVFAAAVLGAAAAVGDLLRTGPAAPAPAARGRAGGARRTTTTGRNA